MKQKKTVVADAVVPMTRFRMRSPKAVLKCNLCNLPASEAEGELLTFQRDKRIVLVHRNCAEFSPDVTIQDDIWYNVIKCVNRGKQLKCFECKKNGATIGCNYTSCKKNYHFGCCNPNWNFEENGKGYYCAQHRKFIDSTSEDGVTPPDVNKYTLSQTKNPESVKISKVSFAFDTLKEGKGEGNRIPDTRGFIAIQRKVQEYSSLPILQFRFKNPTAVIRCTLCNLRNTNEATGKFLFFGGKHNALVHENCLKFSNVANPVPGKFTTTQMNLSKLTSTFSKRRTCFKCQKDGASIRCKTPGCFKHFHLLCTNRWDKTKDFHCSIHIPKNRKKRVLVKHKTVQLGPRVISHDLFYSGADKLPSTHSVDAIQTSKKRKREYAPSNHFDAPLNHFVTKPVVDPIDNSIQHDQKRRKENDIDVRSGTSQSSLLSLPVPVPGPVSVLVKSPSLSVLSRPLLETPIEVSTSQSSLLQLPVPNQQTSLPAALSPEEKVEVSSADV